MIKYYKKSHFSVCFQDNPVIVEDTKKTMIIAPNTQRTTITMAKFSIMNIQTIALATINVTSLEILLLNHVQQAQFGTRAK